MDAFLVPGDLCWVSTSGGFTAGVIQSVDGDKVKVTLRFRGREMAHQDLGAQVLERVRGELDEIAKVEQMPKMEGRQMVMVMSPR